MRVVQSDCAACGQPDVNGRFCAFCRRTVALIKSRRCVACAAEIQPFDSRRHETLCADCRSRGVAVGRGTRWLQLMAAQARHNGRSFEPAVRKAA